MYRWGANELAADYRALMPLEEDYTDLDPAAKGYGVIATNKGRFFIAVEKVETYLDGQRVFLRIGNPSSAAFGGCKLDVTWNSRGPSISSQMIRPRHLARTLMNLGVSLLFIMPGQRRGATGLLT